MHLLIIQTILCEFIGKSITVTLVTLNKIRRVGISKLLLYKSHYNDLKNIFND